MPACSAVSTAEPVAIQKPSAAERTPAMRSVTTLTPEGSVVIRCEALSAASVAGAAAPRTV